jgi:cell division protein FtsL
MEFRLKDFNKFNKETGISFGNLISNKYNLAKQLNVLKIALEKLGVQGIEETEHIMLNN